jgi:hypothetical protein
MFSRLSLLAAIAAAATPSTAYIANAVDFDGTNDYLVRGADFTGNMDDSRGIFSCWARLDGGIIEQQMLCRIGQASLLREFGGGSVQRLFFSLSNAEGSANLRFQTENDYPNSASWLHICNRSRR